MRRLLMTALILAGIGWSAVTMAQSGTKSSPHGELKVACDACHNRDSWAVTGKVSFDHGQTDFPLAGRHTTVGCRECHSSLVFKQTKAGCADCHRDVHNNQFGPTCTRCHTTDGWQNRSAMTQHHDQTRFQLTGVHRGVDCASCHKGGRYANTPITCSGCHRDTFSKTTTPNHQAAGFSSRCEECHSITLVGWKGAAYSHPASFPLVGGHDRSNCNDCHATGYRNTPRTCYPCHQQSYASATNPNHVTGNIPQACETCHNINSWRPASFDHNLSSFKLTGRHQSAACTDCHIGGRFTGTSQACYDCHQSSLARATDPDHARFQYDRNCGVCHSTNGWAGASTRHNIYPLAGAHRALECDQCHKPGSNRFNNQPTDCFGCHEAAYNQAASPNHRDSQFDHNCLACHTNDTWKPATFDHTRTQFPLTGAHRETTCARCHEGGRFAGTPTECFPCHESNYQTAQHPEHSRAQFNHACQSCHTTSAWTPSTFDHQRTTYPLVGAHISVDCASCHIGGVFQGTSHECYNCHHAAFDSTRNPNHTANNYNHNCAICHSMSSWHGATLDHNQTAFPLTGAHRTTACDQCHVGGRFAGTPTDCWSCHQADYNGVEDPNHVTGNYDHNCAVCHTTDNWDHGTFDHTRARFQLAGAHTRLACDACHAGKRYNGTPLDCYTCHQARFEATRNPDHVQHSYNHDCTICHTQESWHGVTFDHSQTQFPLTGAHQTTNCEKCHVAGQYTGTPTDCWTCHQQKALDVTNPNHQTLNYEHDCTVCHNTTSWDQVTFDHNRSQFPLTGSHRTVDCIQCHANKVFTGTPRECYPCHQDKFEHPNAGNDPDHVGGGYPHDCTICHNTDAWHPSTFDHSRTQFPLTGGHRTARCSDCHTNGQWAGLSTECYPCHQADYEHPERFGHTPPNHVSRNFDHVCTSCHTVDGWQPASFDHNLVQYEIVGSHRAVACIDCHPAGRWADTPRDCYTCHTNDFEHPERFGHNPPNHVGGNYNHNCLVCHTQDGWQPAQFDHSAIGYQIVGAHVGRACADCHPGGQFANTPPQCYECHVTHLRITALPADHTTEGYPLNCTLGLCHTQENWNSNFRNTHNRAVQGQMFQIYGGRHRRGGQNWSTCTDCHTFDRQNFATFYGCTECHYHSNRRANYNEQHREVRNYQWTSAACFNCHWNGQADNRIPRPTVPATPNQR